MSHRRSIPKNFKTKTIDDQCYYVDNADTQELFMQEYNEFLLSLTNPNILQNVSNSEEFFLDENIEHFCNQLNKKLAKYNLQINVVNHTINIIKIGG